MNNNSKQQTPEQERPKTMAERLQEESDKRRKKRNRWLIVLMFFLLAGSAAAGLYYGGNAVVGYFFNKALEHDIRTIQTCPDMTADELKKVRKIGFELHRFYVQNRLLKKDMKILNRLHYELGLALVDGKLTREEIEPLMETAEDVLYGIKYDYENAW